MREILKIIQRNKIISIAIAVCLIVIFLTQRKRIKDEKKRRENLEKSIANYVNINTGDLVTDDDGNVAPNPLTNPTLTRGEAKALSARVIEDCKWFGWDVAIWKDLSKLSDVNLIYVSNIFALDFTEFNDGKSLAQYIQDGKLTKSNDINNVINRLNQLTGN